MHCSANGNTTDCALKLVNCVLTNSSSTCLATAACYVELLGTEISDAADEVAYFAGGKVLASQCTFANYYLFKVPSLPIVNVFDVEFNNGTIGKIKADFNNCIIYGMSNEINKGNLDTLTSICVTVCSRAMVRMMPILSTASGMPIRFSSPCVSTICLTTAWAMRAKPSAREIPTFVLSRPVTTATATTAWCGAPSIWEPMCGSRKVTTIPTN